MTIADKLLSILTIKSQIRTAIKAKGVLVNEATPFSQYPAKIGLINAIIDTTPPVIDSFSIVGLVGKTATVTGKTEADASVVLKNPNNVVIPLTVNTDGSFSGTIAAIAVEGNYVLTVSDQAGNVTTTTRTLTLPIADPILTLFTGGVIGAYYDPSDLSTLFQDAAGTIPVTAIGQTVGKMLDKSGNNHHLVMATASRQPKLSKLFNGINYALQWDGIDDHMEGPFTITANIPVVTMAATIEGPSGYDACFAFAVINTGITGTYLGRSKGVKDYNISGLVHASDALGSFNEPLVSESATKSYAIAVRALNRTDVYRKGGGGTQPFQLTAALKVADNIQRIGFGFDNRTLGKSCKLVMLGRELTEAEMTMLTTALKASIGE